jgi:hypothetical protein
MARLCERPGCSTPAEVAYGFDAEQLTVWLDAYNTALGTRAGVLCRRHADAMVVPLGWMLDDRREPVPRLFKPRADETAVSAPPRERSRRSRRSSNDDTEQLVLAVPAELLDDDHDVDAGADLDGATAAVHEPAERLADVDESIDVELDDEEPFTAEPVAPWQPVFDQSDDLQGLLRATSPLLSRAFTGSQRDEP